MNKFLRMLTNFKFSNFTNIKTTNYE